MDRLQTLGDVVTCGMAIFAAIFVPWAIFRARAPQISAAITAFIMSRHQVEPIEKVPVVASVDQRATIAKQPIATTDNEINDLLPVDAREIIRFQAKIEVLADLIRVGQVANLAKGIETTFHCTRSSKEDSTYQRARRALDPLIQEETTYRPLDANKQPV